MRIILELIGVAGSSLFVEADSIQAMERRPRMIPDDTTKKPIPTGEMYTRVFINTEITLHVQEPPETIMLMVKTARSWRNWFKPFVYMRAYPDALNKKGP